MASIRQHSWTVLLVAFGAALATAGRAQTLPRLPEDFLFPASESSPGPVRFSHTTHVDGQQPSCTACHPSLFRILAPGSPADGAPMVHEEMERGKHCGACHNGNAAFAQSDAEKCMSCHGASEP